MIVKIMIRILEIIIQNKNSIDHKLLKSEMFKSDQKDKIQKRKKRKMLKYWIYCSACKKTSQYWYIKSNKKIRQEV